MTSVRRADSAPPLSRADGNIQESAIFGGRGPRRSFNDVRRNRNRRASELRPQPKPFFRWNPRRCTIQVDDEHIREGKDLEASCDRASDRHGEPDSQPPCRFKARERRPTRVCCRACCCQAVASPPPAARRQPPASSTVQPVPQQPDAERVRVRAVVGEQRFVVAVDEEAARAGGDERGDPVGAWGAACRVTVRTPSSDQRASGSGSVISRNARQPSTRSGAAPEMADGSSAGTRTSRPQVSARVPAVLLQEVGDGREDVGQRAPDVAPAVAVEVLRVAQVGRGHELRLPQRAGPRSLQPGELDVAAVEDGERVEQLGAKERRAAGRPTPASPAPESSGARR